MATVVFYEKPNCMNNTRQKKLLSEAGHTVIAKDLLSEAWDEASLLLFFKGLSVADWFNRSAPQVKSGEVIPEKVSAKQALELMIANPLLIRRPLMQVNQDYRVGFDVETVQNWIGLQPQQQVTDLESCPRKDSEHVCH
jgi:nitrogenase-associated protein